MLRTLSRSCTVILLASAGCLPDDPDLEGRPCPCVDGQYVCVADICVLRSEIDAGTTDGGVVRFDTRADVPLDAGADVVLDSVPGDAFDGAVDAVVIRDAGPMDGGNDTPDAPETFCERHGAGAHLCLDFETDYTLLGWTERTAGVNGMLLRSELRSVSGRGLLTRIGEGSFAALSIEVPGITSGTLWQRTKVYVERSAPNQSVGILNAAESGAGTRPFTNINLGNDIPTLLIRGRVPQGQYTQSETAFAFGGWFCVEQSIEIGVDGNVVMYLNGTEVARIPFETTGSWDSFMMGSLSSGALPGPFDIWFDDYVVSSTRVPCELE